MGNLKAETNSDLDVGNGWSLPNLLNRLHTNIQNDLSVSREVFHHAPTKGDSSENTWLETLRNYLPKRYQIEKAHIVDSLGAFSEQIDIVIFDRQYSPFIFDFKGQKIIPAESVYAVFESKQEISKGNIEAAQKKVASVRQLHRTSLPIPHAGGTYPAKPLTHILGGVLALDSAWNPPMGKALIDALTDISHEDERLDIGCVAAHGIIRRVAEDYTNDIRSKAATAFLFELIALLQTSATVPMIDVRAYARWLR